jgi:GT2 family glycosyltransferase
MKKNDQHLTLPTISVVIPNFNGKGYLEGCLSSLATQTYRNFEVIVVDNGSSDGSVEYLETSFPWVRVAKIKENKGFAGGANEGIKQARGEYILTLNNDTLADRRFLECLIKPMEMDTSVGMCASKMILLNDKIDSTGIRISLSGAAYDRGFSNEDHGQYDFQEEVFGPCAGAALYRKKMLDKTGSFDEDFHLFMEDVDLAFRARLAGWKCIYVPEAKVHHFHGGTAGFRSDICVYYGNRNIIWYVLKDYPLRLLIFCLPWIILRNLVVIPYYALKGKGRVILASKLDALQGIPLMLKKRGDVHRIASDWDMLRFIIMFA